MKNGIVRRIATLLVRRLLNLLTYRRMVGTPGIHHRDPEEHRKDLVQRLREAGL